jgi:hypothetical protein
MGWLAIVAMALVAVIDVRVTTLDGKTVDGRLKRITPAAVELGGPGAESIPLERVLSVERAEPSSPPVAGPTVGLFGGSRLAIESIESSADKAELRLRGGQAFSLPVTQIAWVRFRTPSPAVDPQWLGLVEQRRLSDTLVIRRPGDAIDQVDGVVLGVGAESISFSLDGETMQAPLAKLEGLLLKTPAGPQEEAKPSPKAVVEDIHGSRWVALDFGDIEGDKVRLKLSPSIDYDVPLDSIRKVELQGSIEFLASQAPVSSEYRPYVSIGLSAELMSQWLGPQVVEGRDLMVCATTEVNYRVSEGFQTLAGSVEVEPQVTLGGECVVKVWLDDKVVWEQTLDVDKPDPRGFELPVGGARRIRFEVLSGQGGDLGDTVRFRQVRLLK